ncbi:Cache 3/Cache 2 fusion domain-containing protein [uncultured Desulfuromonas sp.]|uniref:Cache 3/Cache 2 fusion domain-containing protein n=1 Tax=uncultured Desulfuromonas sp. TaxID=181013 RepID=UPI002AAB8EA0|nr:Cache 3/Cache 2 fusion domain-containing protein [uncultured Desulfuromonas sp.]
MKPSIIKHGAMMKIRSKIAIMALVLVLLTALSIVSVVFYQLNYVQDEIEEELLTIEFDQTKNILRNTILMIEALQAEVERRLHYDLNAAQALLNSSGGVQITPHSQQWTIMNQYDHSSRDVVLPTLDFVSNNNVYGPDHWQPPSTSHFIEHLSEVLGVTCTLFQRIDPQGDMLRVATTVPSSNGRAAVGTYIPAQHPDGSFDPVIRQVLQGQRFVGRAFVVDDWYNTAYHPLYDQQKNIIGMLYVGERQSELDSLIHSIQHIAADSRGALFIMEAQPREGQHRQGVVQTLTSSEHDPMRSGHTSKDAQYAEQILGKLLNEKRLALTEEINVLHADDRLNDVSAVRDDHVIVYSYFAPWDWLIGIYSKCETASSTQQRLGVMFQRTVASVCITAFLWFSLALWLAFRLATQISKPLEKAVDGFRRVGQGDLDYELGHASGFEIEALYRSFDTMVRNLHQVTASRDELDLEVNARRQIEQKLQNTVATLETIIREAPMSIVVVTQEGYVVMWNPSAEKIFGWKEEEVLGELYPLVRGDEMTEECLNYKKLVENGLILQAREMQRYHKDGHKLDLLVSAACLAGPDSPCKNILILLEDISAFKKTQRQLQEREEQYKLLSAEFQSILDSIEDVISLVSPDMKILWCNHGKKRWNKKETILPMISCYSVWDKNLSECKNCPIRKSFETGESHSAIITTPDGVRWGIKTFPQKNNDGHVTNVIEVASDITESSILREEAMRSARLASLGELSAGIAHEINNPNGVIMQNAPIISEMLESLLPILDDYVRDHGDFTVGRLPYSRVRDKLLQIPRRVLDSSYRIKAIVDDLKDFVRDEGHQDVQNQADLNYALEAAVRLTSNTVKKATNHFSVNYAEGLPLFIGSVQRIEQVIVNLIMNACQALPDMEASIAIQTRYDAESNQIELEIIDQGCGITEENIAKVTNPFFTTKRETGGTGLGLSISSRIIEEHGGRLSIESVVDSGTAITISLPCHKEDA